MRRRVALTVGGGCSWIPRAEHVTDRFSGTAQWQGTLNSRQVIQLFYFPDPPQIDEIISYDRMRKGSIQERKNFLHGRHDRDLALEHCHGIYLLSLPCRFQTYKVLNLINLNLSCLLHGACPSSSRLSFTNPSLG